MNVKKKLKICLITNAYSPTLIGGSTVYTVRISKELAKRGYDVIVVAADTSCNETIINHENIKIYTFRPFNVATSLTIGRKSLIAQGVWTLFDIYNYYSYLKIKNILRKENPDVVHLHTPIDVTLAAIDAIKNSGYPLVMTVHDYLLLCRRVVLLHGDGTICTDHNRNFLCDIYRAVTKRIVNNKIDVALFPSQFILDMFVQNGFFKGSKKIVLPYGISLNNGNGLMSQKIKTNTKVINVLYVGGLTKNKGVTVLIEAVKKIESENIHLDIVGHGVYENALRKAAGSDKRITFHGKIYNEHIDQFYKKADVLVVPSLWYEVLGIVIQEAFRAGIPVIGSRIGGIVELIKDNYNGFLFDAGNVVQLKEILEKVIENQEDLHILGNNAREYVKKYEMKDHIDKLILNYEDAIAIKR